MGVDFYACANCGRTFPDCGYYFSCYTCNHHFCSNDCGGREVEQDPNDPDGTKGYEEITTCILCRKEDATDYQLLKFLLNHFKITREQAMELYRNGEQGNLPGSS